MRALQLTFNSIRLHPDILKGGGGPERGIFFKTANRRASRATPCSRSRREIHRGSRGNLRLFRIRLVDRTRNWTARDWIPNWRTRVRCAVAKWKLWRMPGYPACVGRTDRTGSWTGSGALPGPWGGPGRCSYAVAPAGESRYVVSRIRKLCHHCVSFFVNPVYQPGSPPFQSGLGPFWHKYALSDVPGL